LVSQKFHVFYGPVKNQSAVMKTARLNDTISQG